MEEMSELNWKLLCVKENSDKVFIRKLARTKYDLIIASLPMDTDSWAEYLQRRVQNTAPSTQYQP